MNNSYIVAAVIVLVAIIALVANSKKSEAPITTINQNATGTPITLGSYKLDAEKSVLSWKGEFVTGFAEVGTLKLQSGEVNLLADGGVSGEFVIDMNTIESIPRKDMLVNHLKNEDFFEVATYPTAIFVLKTMEPTSEEGARTGRFVLGGDLTIKGKTLPISFIATFAEDVNSLSAVATFAINRADWEVKYNSSKFFSGLGDKVIRDAVEITLDLKGVKVIQ
jgi:polyisoprenoid-binding protein YceI